MNEIELLKRLIELEKQANDYDLRIQIWTNQEEKVQFVREFERISGEIEELKTQLVTIENKPFSREAKSSIIDQLQQYINEINDVSPSLSVSRNQGFMLENELFSGIVQDVNYMLIDRIFGIRIPAYLKYTTNPNDSINISELTDFLRNEIIIIKNIENPNFIKLREYLDRLIDRIREQFID